MEGDGCGVRGTTQTDRKFKKKKEKETEGGERERAIEREIEREKEPLNTRKADVIKKQNDLVHPISVDREFH